MTSERAEDLKKSADAGSGQPQPPAANQPAGEAPEDADVDVAAKSAPDDAVAGVSPSGVSIPAGAPPGKPDGEVDTRPGIDSPSGRP